MLTSAPPRRRTGSRRSCQPVPMVVNRIPVAARTDWRSHKRSNATKYEGGRSLCDLFGTSQDQGVIPQASLRRRDVSSCPITKYGIQSSDLEQGLVFVDPQLARLRSASDSAKSRSVPHAAAPIAPAEMTWTFTDFDQQHAQRAVFFWMKWCFDESVAERGNNGA